MAAITSAQTGVWSATATWTGGVVPVLGDKVTIQAAHTVTVDGTYSAGDDTTTAFNIAGTLKASRTVSSQLTVRGDIIIGTTAGGINYGTVADPIPSGFTAVLVLNDSAAMALNKYGIKNTSGNLFSGIHFHGAVKTVRALTTAAVASGVSVVPFDDTTGWAIGDRVYFRPTTSARTSYFSRVIQSIAGLNVTFTAAMPAGGVPTGWRAINATRNVRVLPSSVTYGAAFSIFLASTQAAGSVTLNYVEFVGPSGVANIGFPQFTSVSNNNVSFINDITGMSQHEYNPAGTQSVITGGIGLFLTGYRAYTPPVNIKDFVACTPQYPAFVLANGSIANFNNPVLINFGGTGNLTSSKGVTMNSPELYGCGNVILYVSGGSGFTINNPIIDSGGNLANAAGNGKMVINGGNIASLGINAGVIPELGGVGSYEFIGTTFGAGLTLRNATGWNTNAIDIPDNYIRVTAKNGDVTAQELHTTGGSIYRDNALFYRGLSSIRLDPLAAGRTTSKTLTIAAPAGVPVRLVGYVRKTAAYNGTTPTFTISGGNLVAPVVFSASGAADTWQQFDQTVTNPGTTSTFTLTIACTGTAGSVYLDGIPDLPFVNAVYHYGFTVDTTNAARTVDPLTILSETAALALAGIAVNHGTQTITLTASHTIRELYDYVAADLVANNLGAAAVIASADAVNWTCRYNITVQAGSTLTGTGALNLGAKTFTGTSSLIVTDISGTTGLLTLSGLTTATVAVYNAAGAQVDYVASVTGSYTLALAAGLTGTWKWVVKRAGYKHATGTFLPATGGNFTNAPSLPQMLNPDGTAMYAGTASGLLAVSFTGTSNAYLDIGDGVVPLQSVFDESEVALTTAAGMAWLRAGLEGLSQFNSASGDFLFMSAGWRLRRAAPGDTNATVQAFAVSTDGVPVDEVNGPVRYLATDSATTIAQAVRIEIERIGGMLAAVQAAVHAPIAADVRYVNGIQIKGNGTPSNTWGPV